MPSYKSDFLNHLDERGFIAQCSDADALEENLSKGVVTGYIGFDCTAPSLHAGSLVQIMMLRALQKAGHRPIVVIGGGTTRIGDPSFRDSARPLLDDDAIAKNKEGIRKVFSKFLSFDDGPTGALMVDNREWLDGLDYVDFLRDVGRHFSVNRMLSFESVKARLEREQNLSFLEFNYMIIQAYDFAELYRRYDCTLQMGGSDQWGNIVNGIDLGRRMDDSALIGLTSPLLTTSSGTKMGKTADGAVWLNEDMLPAYDYWQYWRNCEDADVGKLLRLFTDLSLDEIGRLEKLEGAELNDAKKVLATEATAMAHGRAAAESAEETARKTFEEGSVASDLPTVAIAADMWADGLGLLTALVEAKLSASTSEARRLVHGGGVRINDDQVSDWRRSLGEDDIRDGAIKLSAGKKRHVLIKKA
ncbi:Tyrosyl-tRNA synthetase [Candidatus Phaeomarinobacter ectocarpi]|uniref:Tyrosine--tRNA ligase n=1 Tax=Candidatus Phaeomarinibacter ectocarpi TaxID=1458461 RepID=X5MN22_9HYPH|nr:tyrosine--tRNA ligase [Candidatus Phaeomarinobacter ectocarpi]CDO60925.1 Tyrosyl-tRNA synthetase [Candidatus Phaeomarinobacter ectocarpi]